MAHLTKSVVVLALAILAGACAQKSANVIPQPAPTGVQEVAPEVPAEVPLETYKEPISVEEWVMEDGKPKVVPEAPPTYRDDIDRRDKEEKEGRKARSAQNEEEAYGRVINSERERGIRARGQEIAEERAEKRVESRIRRADTPEEARARREVTKTEREHKKQEEALDRANALASIIGCDSGTEVLHAGAEQRRGAFGTSAEVTVVNASDIPWNIRTDSRYLGHIVKDICVGGSMGLHFTRSFWQRWREWSPIQAGRGGNRRQQETILLVATGTVKDESGQVIRTVVRELRVRINSRTNEVSRTDSFILRGNYLPKESKAGASGTTGLAPRVRRPRRPRG